MTISTVRLIFRANGGNTDMRRLIFPSRDIFCLTSFPLTYGELQAPALGLEINEATFFRGSETLFIVRHYGSPEEVVVLIVNLSDLYAIERISHTGLLMSRHDPFQVRPFPE